MCTQLCARQVTQQYITAKCQKSGVRILCASVYHYIRIHLDTPDLSIQHRSMLFIQSVADHAAPPSAGYLEAEVIADHDLVFRHP